MEITYSKEEQATRLTLHEHHDYDEETASKL
jgi:hypothetical protein